MPQDRKWERGVGGVSRRDLFRTALAAAGAVAWARGVPAFAKSKRRDGGPMVNLHAHWYPEAWLKLVAAEGAASGVKVFRTNEGAWRIESTKQNVTMTPDYYDLDVRLKIMDSQGIDYQAFSMTTPMVDWAPADLSLRLAQAFNDSASEAHRAHPKRLLGLASLPLQYPDLARKEVERASKLDGIRGVCLPTNVNGKELDHADFHPIYEACERLGWPVVLHPVDTIGPDRTGRFYLRNLIGNPYDTGVAGAYLIFGGVLDKFPKLEVSLPHGGGTLPWLIGRWDRGVKMRPELKHMKMPASAYLRRFTYDTITHDDEQLLTLIHKVGADRVVLGDDFPFDMGYEKPVDVVDRIKGITAKDRDFIYGGTAARLLKIEA